VNTSYHCALTVQSSEILVAPAYECHLVYAEHESSTTCRFGTRGAHDESRDADRTVQAVGHTTRMLEARGFTVPPGNAPASPMCRIRLPHIVSEVRMAIFECARNCSPLTATFNARRRIGRRGPSPISDRAYQEFGSPWCLLLPNT
jgi:hypothetical protein